ncbi:hypothetical protein ISS30_04335 [bacterium]|nr:hypothetical protein [FCB group bacterium]MBL7190901.1 hypothetical protein [bacterium]
MSYCRIILVIAVFNLLISCYSVKQCERQPPPEPLVMPSWFWDTPRIEGLQSAVGYSQFYRDGPDAYREAFLDGAWRLFNDEEAYFAGARALSSGAGVQMSMGSTINMRIDSTGFDDFVKYIVRVDSFAAENMRIMLVAADEFQPEKGLCPSPPANNVKVPEAGVFTGYSVTPKYYYSSSSWIEAERIARIELAVNASSKIKSVENVADGNILSTIIVETDINMVNIQTVQRRFNWEHGMYEVWVTGETNDKRY